MNSTLSTEGRMELYRRGNMKTKIETYETTYETVNTKTGVVTLTEWKTPEEVGRFIFNHLLALEQGYRNDKRRKQAFEQAFRVASQWLEHGRISNELRAELKKEVQRIQSAFFMA